MHAVEFKARITNGMIEIPEEYKDSFRDEVRVILLAEEEREDSTVNLIDQLLEQPLEIEDFEPLMREEVHARR